MRTYLRWSFLCGLVLGALGVSLYEHAEIAVWLLILVGLFLGFACGAVIGYEEKETEHDERTH